MNVKPVKHIQNIIDYTSPYSSSLLVPRGGILDYMSDNIQHCYFLLEGSITLNRRWDGMVLNSQQYPFISGVSHQLSCGDNLYVRTAESSRLCKMPLERFNLLIEKYALWESFCYLLIYTTSSIYEQCSAVSQMSSSEIVMYHLRQLMLEPSRLRNSMTAAGYIMDKTLLSRSGIMRILRQLREAKCIILERGILVGINHLPTKD
mgnify:FL=1